MAVEPVNWVPKSSSEAERFRVAASAKAVRRMSPVEILKACRIGPSLVDAEETARAKFRWQIALGEIVKVVPEGVQSVEVMVKV